MNLSSDLCSVHAPSAAYRMLGFGQERVNIIVSLQELSKTREEVRIRIDAQVATLMAERMRIDPFNQPGRKYTPYSLVEVHTHTIQCVAP